MDCGTIEVSALVEEGSFSAYEYTLKDEDGNDITSVDKLEWKLSDGANTLIDWTVVAAPDLPSGTIKIPGSANRVETIKDRYFTLHANYNVTEDDSFSTKRYKIIDSPNITQASPI